MKKISDLIFQQIKSYGFANVSEGLVGDLTHQFSPIQKPTARSLILRCFQKWLREAKALTERFDSFFDSQSFSLLYLDVDSWMVEYDEKMKGDELSRSGRFSELVQKILQVQAKFDQLMDINFPEEITLSAEWQTFFQRKITLEQVLDENIQIDKEKIKQKKGDRKIISDVDPEARSGYKNSEKRFTGYKIEATMTTDGFIPNVETIPGNESDTNRAIPMVEKAMEVSGETPEYMSLDSAFDTIENRKELHAKGIQPGIVNKKKTNPRNPGLYTSEDFDLNVETSTVTCPAQEQTSKRTINNKKYTQTFRFPKKICHKCPQRKKCTTSKTGRSVNFTTETELIAHDQEYLKSTTYEESRKDRWGLEGRFGTTKSYLNLLKTPYHGREKSSVHNRLVFTVLNLKRLIRLLFFPPTPSVLPVSS